MTLEEVYADVKEKVTGGRPPLMEKRGTVLCAQPGAGKSTCAAGRDGCLRMDGDRLTDLCGGLTAIADYVSARLLREAAGAGWNILYETPLSDLKGLTRMCRKGKEAGYSLSLCAVACDAVTALYATLERSRQALRRGEFVRLCSYEFYVAKTKAFCGNFPVLAQSELFDAVTVLSRNGDILCRTGREAAEIIRETVDLSALESRKTDFQREFFEFVQKNGLMQK